MQQLQTQDYIVFLIYFVIVASYGYWVYWKKKKVQTDSKDFFLAEGALTWWAIGASLIASKHFRRTIHRNVGLGFQDGPCHCHVRVDGCRDTNCCSSFLHADLSEEQDLHHAAIFDTAV